MSQIEVVKGPQGTLYGRNSEGGLISILTRDPTLAGTSGTPGVVAPPRTYGFTLNYKL